MIVNVPKPESLHDVALRLYFSAWERLMDIRSDFEQAFEPTGEPDGTGNEIWDQEWAEYVAACQPELQSICSLIQQSNELALKAKICEVSPYLLLLRNDAKFGTTPKDVDFSDFRTLDAVELPGAVNTCCSEPLSDKFIQAYNQIRSLRNKIAHLGQSEGVLDRENLLHILVFQYHELWKGRGWLRDRVLFASKTRLSFFHDYKYTSPYMDVMHELPQTLRVLTKSEFKKLFGRSKGARRYLCHVCIENANTRFASLDFDACKTAFLNQNKSTLSCIMCGETYTVTLGKCSCGGTIIGDNDDDYAGWCHSCGDEGGDELPT